MIPRLLNNPRIAMLPGMVMPFGLQLVKNSLNDNGISVGDFSEDYSPGDILMSLYWVEDLYEWIRWRKRNNIGSEYSVIVGGNHVTGYPNTIAPFADHIYIGDGDNWDGTIDNQYPRPPAYCGTLRKECINMELKSVSTDRVAPIIEMGRGCLKKCLFCQYTWMKPYREQDGDFVLDELQDRKKIGVRLVSVDCLQHSRHNEFVEIMRKNNIRNLGQDNSIETLRKAITDGHEPMNTKTYRFGIDGQSARLRALMNKNITHENLVDLIDRLCKLGASRILAYNIYGLPTETEDDCAEYIRFLRDIADLPYKFTFITHWSAFLPCSLTPLQWEASSWRRDCRRKDELMGTVKYGKERGKNIIHMPYKTNDDRITYRLLAMRGSKKTKNLIYSVALNKKIRESQILAEFKKQEGYGLHERYNDSDVLPWDDYVLYDKTNLLKIKKKKGL